MTDHDHGEFYAKRRKEWDKKMTKLDAELDALLADEKWNMSSQQTASFWEKHPLFAGAVVGCAIGVVTGLGFWLGRSL